MGTYTRLGDNDITTVAYAYGLGAVLSWESIPQGTVNSNFRVKTETGYFAVRVNEGKDISDVMYESALIAALCDAGIRIPRPCMVTATMMPVFWLGTHAISVFPWVAGQHIALSDIKPIHARAIGRALAEMHTVSIELDDSFERVSRFSFSEIHERVRALHDSDDVYLQPALAEFVDEVAWFEQQADIVRAAQRGVIHSDLFPDNVLFEGSRLAWLLDFEMASTGSLVGDLAVCINAWCVRELPLGTHDQVTGAYKPTGPANECSIRIEPKLVRAMVEGYESVRALSADEMRALQVELRFSAMRFTVTRITDLYLTGHVHRDKDFRHFLHRLRKWREIAVGDLLK